MDSLGRLPRRLRLLAELPPSWRSGRPLEYSSDEECSSVDELG